MSRTRIKKTNDGIKLLAPPGITYLNENEFVVNDYDYFESQNSAADPQFEKDLQYLLCTETIQESPIKNDTVSDLVISDTTKSPNNDNNFKAARSRKLSKLAVDDITKDILDLNFSDNEAETPKPEEPEEAPRLKGKKSHGKLDRNASVENSETRQVEETNNGTANKRTQRLSRQKSADFRNKGTEASASEKKLNKLKSLDLRSFKDESSLRKRASMNKVGEIFRLEVPDRLDEIETESEVDDSVLSITEEVDDAAKERRRLKNKRRKERRSKANQFKRGKEAIAEVEILATAQADGTLELDDIIDVQDTSDLVATLESNSTPAITKKMSDPEISRVRKVTFTQETEEPPKKLSIEETLKLNKKKSMELLSQTNPTLDPNNPFDIKLRSTKKSTMNSKYSNKLPEIQPSKTIIGLSHKQILNLDVSDVKLKTILSSSKISKYSSTSLNFTIKHSNDLFKDFDKKKIFFLLCVNVALYESIGFKKTVQLYPNILELFGGYTEINLETTKTKLTPSSKDIHQNNLDYSVLSYIGNILIWALHQQRQNNEPLIDSKFDLGVSPSLVRENFGGYHLWDRLIREPQGMNAKRWKHIIKFRQAFAYEEDQFVLILRFMRVDS